MSNKSKQVAPSRTYAAQINSVFVVEPPTKVSTYRAGNNSFEMQNTSRAVQKSAYDGTTTTTRNSQIMKGGEFVDRRSGNNGYREEVRFQTTKRVNDRVQGVTKEYQTEVKFKETTTYHKSNNNNNYYNGGGSGYNYNNYDDDEYYY
ncbi:hypothetical protein LIER_38257 [Lithospermum erythrorhizon]|uniref:Uncharacterized protein n=1 Tax=Lithospermum erythrorhizon TaxID=34254 RepID=A0AAV3PXW8_LITER